MTSKLLAAALETMYGADRRREAAEKRADAAFVAQLRRRGRQGRTR